MLDMDSDQDIFSDDSQRERVQRQNQYQKKYERRRKGAEKNEARTLC